MDSLLEGIFHAMICGWILMTSMWCHWNDFYLGNHLQTGLFQLFQASALFNFSRKYLIISPWNSNYIQPEISTWHMFCLGMTYASWGCCESTTWGPSWFLGLGTRARKRCNEERTAVACFFDVLSLISLGTRWCPIFREVREHNWRFPKIGVTPNHTSHLTILLLNTWFWYIVVLTVCWLHPRICGIVWK